MEILIIIIVLFFIYLLLKPAKAIKSKEEKQNEIAAGYKQKLLESLSGMAREEERRERKTELLKLYAKELNRNLFFDENEVRALIQELAKV